MRNSSIIAWCLVMALSAVSAVAFAHGTEKHKPAPANAQMQKLHDMMPMYEQAETKIKEALTTGDAATIREETAKILATIPDLKNAKPHKNAKQTAAFRKIASAFAGDVKKTATMAKTGDIAGAKAAFQVAQIRCNECHEKFRD